nr:MAG TPA: minor capsid protein [Caudoviricetes sp.]
MITPEQFQEIGETLLPLLDDLTEWIARDMIERFMIRFGRGEKKLLTGTDEWQAWVLKQAGGNLDEIQKALAKSTGKSQQEIAKIFKGSGIQAAKADAEAAAVTFSGLSSGMMAIITDAYERTVGEISNITRTTAGATNQAFIDICDTAYWKVRTGAQSYTAAMLEGIKELGQVQPIVCYPSGHKDTLEVAVLRCIRTGVAQSSGNMTIQQCKDMGWNHVLVSQHLGARVSDTDPIANHAGWQGKVYCIDGKDAQFDNLLDATGYPENPLGLCGYNCRHSFTPFLPGVSQNHNKPIDTEANRRAYELSQTQRAMERRIRAQKRKCTALHTAVKNCEDPAGKAKLQEKYTQSAKHLQDQNAAYAKFCEENDLKPYHERLAVAGWDHSAASTASAAARQSWTSAEAVDARQVQTQQAPPVQAPPVIAKLDVQRYSCVAEHIRSSDVILTEKQKEHIIERRGKEFYDKYSPYFKEIIENPDYIFKDKKYENTAIASKTISLNSKNISVVVRIAVEGDEPWRKSSVITVMCENEKRYRQRVRNNIILYKRE